MRKFTFQVAMALACLCPGTAFGADAADCRLKLVNTVPITMAYGGARPLVSVKVNGTELKFLLDTGGVLTQISAATARDLKLPITESGAKLLDLYGDASNNVAMVDTFILGRLNAKNTGLHVMTSPLAQAGPSRNDTTQQEPLFVGLLAADYMGEYDTELDFAGGKMNYFLQDHCPGKVVYWPAAATAVVPMHFMDHHLILDVTLDGHPFRAIVDTGAPGTTLTMEEAKRVFDLTAEDADKRFEHTFQKLSFEGLDVGNPHIAIIPDKIGSKDPNNGYATGTRVRREDDPIFDRPPMLIGMNILSKLHLYIAFSENRIYITPAAAPAQPASSQ